MKSCETPLSAGYFYGPIYPKNELLSQVHTNNTRGLKKPSKQYQAMVWKGFDGLLNIFPED